MTEQRLAHNNTIAVFNDAAAADGALEHLERAGYVPEETSLVGPDRQKPPGPPAPGPSDGGLLPRPGRHLVIGVVVGGGAGGALAALVGIALTVLAGASDTLWISAGVAGAVMGTVAGSLIALETAGRKGSMWEQSLHPLVPRVRDGATLIGVHVDRSESASYAAEILEEAGADEIHMFTVGDEYPDPWTRTATVGAPVPSNSPSATGGKVDAAG